MPLKTSLPCRTRGELGGLSRSIGFPELTIGEVARRAGVATSSIRYYERIGLLPTPARESSQRRLLERTKAMKGWLEVAAECGCATPAQCALFPGPGEGSADSDVALRVVTVDGRDCRRPTAH